MDAFEDVVGNVVLLELLILHLFHYIKRFLHTVFIIESLTEEAARETFGEKRFL